MSTEFGAFLRAARKATKLKGYELAAKLGVSNSTITGWEKGEHLPELHRLPALVDALRLDEDGQEQLGALWSAAKQAGGSGVPLGDPFGVAWRLHLVFHVAA